MKIYSKEDFEDLQKRVASLLENPITDNAFNEAMSSSTLVKNTMQQFAVAEDGYSLIELNNHLKLFKPFYVIIMAMGKTESYEKYVLRAKCSDTATLPIVYVLEFKNMILMLVKNLIHLDPVYVPFGIDFLLSIPNDTLS